MRGNLEFPFSSTDVRDDAITEGVDSFQPKFISLLGPAAHAGGVDWSTAGMNCHDMSRRKQVASIVCDPRAFDLADLLHLVFVTRIERPLEVFGMFFHAEAAQGSQSRRSFFYLCSVEGDVVGRLFLQ